MKTYKDENGNKLYPVCSWEKNQHKLYNALDKANIRMYDIRDGLIDGDIDKAYEEIELIEHLLEVFNSHVIGNTVYATYEDSIKIKEYVTAYDCKTDELKAIHNNSDEFYGADF